MEASAAAAPQRASLHPGASPGAHGCRLRRRAAQPPGLSRSPAAAASAGHLAAAAQRGQRGWEGWVRMGMAGHACMHVAACHQARWFAVDRAHRPAHQRLGINLQHRHILIFIISHHLGRQPLAARQRDLARRGSAGRGRRGVSAGAKTAAGSCCLVLFGSRCCCRCCAPQQPGASQPVPCLTASPAHLRHLGSRDSW